MSDGVGKAALSRRDAASGEKGIIEELGSVAVTLLNAGGADMLLTLLRSALGGPGQAKSKPRKVRVKTSRGEIELEGNMTDADFLATRDRFEALLQEG